MIKRLGILLLFLFPTILIGLYLIYTFGWVSCALITWIKQTPFVLCKIHSVTFDSSCLHLFMGAFAPVLIKVYKTACACLNRDLRSIIDYLLTNIPLIIFLLTMSILLTNTRAYNITCIVAGFLIKCMIVAPFIEIIIRRLKWKE